MPEYRYWPGISCQPSPGPCQLTDSVACSPVTVSVTGVSWPATSWTGAVWFCHVLLVTVPGTGAPVRGQGHGRAGVGGHGDVVVAVLRRGEVPVPDPGGRAAVCPAAAGWPGPGRRRGRRWRRRCRRGVSCRVVAWVETHRKALLLDRGQVAARGCRDRSIVRVRTAAAVSSPLAKLGRSPRPR